MDTLTDSFKTPEVRKKILFTFLIVSVLGLLTIVPIPGLYYYSAIDNIIGWGSMGTVMNILSGHALENVSIISLGIYPFLVASIVMQIVVLAVPRLRNLSQMGEEGQKVVTKLTRIASIIASVVFLMAYLLYAEVLRENTYLSRTIEVQENQKVIDTGLYGIVRHPMYMATIILFLAMPLVLGASISFVIMLCYIPLIIMRIRNEEQVLEKDLSGYSEYKKKVRYRLIPHIW